ncbi:MAG: MGMT family protein [Gemmatimonadetes bacterium]|nr:MGMT family protein [Gemmatimonadota bacterium]
MTPFAKSVYALVSAIPSGSVTSYGMVAAALGRPRAPRSVGGALSALPEDLYGWSPESGHIDRILREADA